MKMVTMTSEVDKTQTSIAMSAKPSAPSSLTAEPTTVTPATTSESGTETETETLTRTVAGTVTEKRAVGVAGSASGSATSPNSNKNNENLASNLATLTIASAVVSKERTEERNEDVEEVVEEEEDEEEEEEYDSSEEDDDAKPALARDIKLSSTLAAPAAISTTFSTTTVASSSSPSPSPTKTSSVVTKTSTFTSSTCSSSNNTSSSSIGTKVSSCNPPITAHSTITSIGTSGAITTTLNINPNASQSQTQSQSQSQAASCSSSAGASGGSAGPNGLGAKSNILSVPSKNVNHHQLHPAMPQQSRKNEDAPNIMVYKKMEQIIEKMQAESTGVQVRTVKAFMTKVPSVFTGADLISWILKNTDVEDVTEALHFSHLLASHGYIFPIDDHALTVKNDGTFYRFQTPYFWPSNCWEPENTDYAVYLCKRTMQNKTRLELADYEAENLAKLQKMFSRKWEFIFMQAESQSKVAKKRDKLERKVLDSQERAFWDVHRPMPGCVNTTEIDIKKAYRRGASSQGTGSGGPSLAKNPIEQCTRLIGLRKQKLERRTIKVSKAAESLVAYYEQYNEFDYFITSPELPNPWQTDSLEMWDAEKNTKEVTLRRVKRWSFSLRELLIDPVGRDQFTKFLEKEYSGENLKFWESVQQMKALPQSEIKEAIHNIWQEFLAPEAPCPVNVDSKSVELAREAVSAPNGPNRWCFDVAAAHVYHLMKSDSYSRYLRSDMYKDYLTGSRKKIKSIPNLFGVKR